MGNKSANSRLSWQLRVFFAIMLLVAACIALTLGTDKDTADVETIVTATPPAGPATELRIAQVFAPNSLDPTFLSGRDTAFAIYNIFDRLYAQDHTLQFVPSLAIYHEYRDEITWRFHLRRGVKFHNGNDFKANDVKFTIDRYQEANESTRLGTTSAIEDVRIVDDYTVDIILKYPYAAFLTQSSLMEMLDEEYYLEVGDEGLAVRPVGTGPYKFVEWDQEQGLVLEINEGYWGRVPRQIKTLMFVPISEADDRTSALERDKVDIIASVPCEYEAKPGIRLEELIGTRAYYVGLNVDMEPFDDREVRQAMNFAVDVDAIIETVLNGRARKLDGPLYPETFGYTEIGYYSYDPGKARRMLAGAGYPDGFEVTLDYYAGFEDVAEILQAQYEDVGVQVNLNLMDKGDCYDKYEPGDSQMFLTSWGNREADASPLFRRQFHSDRVKAYTNYNNPEFDALVNKADATQHARNRQGIHAEALEIVIKDAPWVYLYNASGLCGVADSVKKWQARQYCPNDQ